MVLGQFDLTGKVAIVTGAGRGLGKAMALALAEAGAEVACVARTREEVEATAAEIRGLGRRALAIPTDVTDAARVNAMVEITVAELGRVDILINNAGGGGGSTPIEEVSDEEWRAVIELNLSSAFNCLRAVVPYMAKQGSGKVINISSGLAFRSARDTYAYNTAKAGVVNFTRVAAVSLASNNIQVNSIAPGFFPHRERLTEEQWSVVERRVRFQVMRSGRDEEIGPLAVFLASPASDYMTGATVVIDGGAIAGAYAPAGFPLTLAAGEGG